MQDHWRRDDGPPKGLLDRLDRAAGNINAYLLVVAIGLAALDFTCFWVLQVRNTLPSAGRAGANAAISQPTVPANNTVATVKSSRSSGAITGF